MSEQSTLLTPQAIVSHLMTPAHGKLETYIAPARQALATHKQFVAHALAWNRRHGTIRDVQVALPVLTLAAPGQSAPLPYRDQALALLACLDPRDLVAAWAFGKVVGLHSHARRRLSTTTHAYLRAREACEAWWDRTALGFRADLTCLYRLSHTKPDPRAQAWLFDGQAPPGSVFARLQQCPQWEADEVAGFLRAEQIPALVAEGYLNHRLTEPAILAAMLDRYTPAQLLRRRKAIQRWGGEDAAMTRGALQAATARSSQQRQRGLGETLRQTQEAVADDGGLTAELEAITEAQLDQAPGIEGNWLWLIDVSGSMTTAMEPGCRLAAYVARQTRGQVWLCFFNHEPYFREVTGKTYAEIQAIGQAMTSDGGTSIGCGLAAALERKLGLDAIGIVSDGGQRHPPTFLDAYARYSAWAQKQVPVYLYRVAGQDPDWLSGPCQHAGIPYQVFPLTAVDQVSLESLAQTMRTQRYSLLDEILATPLVTLEQALRVPRHFREKEASYARH
jgi:hypothetical protein